MLIELSDHIPLPWEPPFDKDFFRHILRNNAHHFWFDNLFDHCHDPSCQCEKMQHHLSPDPSEVIEVFEEYCGEYLNEVFMIPGIGSRLSRLNKWLLYYVR